jgi:hypothetical protein
MWRGVKSIFHSMRILQFFDQIKENGHIVDFTSANDIWIMLKEDYETGHTEWDYYKKKYLPMKIELEKKLQS